MTPEEAQAIVEQIRREAEQAAADARRAGEALPGRP